MSDEQRNDRKWETLVGVYFAVMVLMWVYWVTSAPPGYRQAVNEQFVRWMLEPWGLLFLLTPVLLALLPWLGLYYSLRRTGGEIEQDPRVREPFKDRFIRGDYQPGYKVVCSDCGDIHNAVQIDCPECGSTNIESG